jgi:hypothetical protein
MRGHYDNMMIEARSKPIQQFCTRCGAPVITACPVCDGRLLGAYPNVVASYGPDQFCGSCGSPYPWANRESMIMQLRNQLEFEPGLDSADRLELIEQLAVLSGPEEDDKKRVRAGKRVKELAPKGWAVAGPILQTLLSAEIRSHLGLPPG